MYARMQVSTGPLSIAPLSAAPGFTGAYLLEQVGVDRQVLVSLWSTENDALRAPVNGDPVVHEVVSAWSGMADGESPAAATVLHFDGPQSEVQYRAAEFAFEQRVGPALVTVPGMVRGFTLWQPEYRSVTVVSLGTSVDALDAGGKAVMSTELLPSEDPALLPGPDRVEIHRVLDAKTMEVTA